MSGLAIVCILTGIFIIAARGPLIFWPEPTREFYLKLISSNNRSRVLGLFLGLIGGAFIVASRASDHEAAVFIQLKVSQMKSSW